MKARTVMAALHTTGKAKGVSAARSASIEAMLCFSKVAASTIESNKASDKGKPESPARRVPIDDMIKVAVNNLVKQKGAARPRTQKTLRNAIHSWCGKERSAADFDAVYDALVKRGCVVVIGAKVTYALPGAQEAA